MSASTERPARFDAFLYVVHLLGTGHIRRTAAIANHVARLGRSVCLVSGGMPLENLQLHSAVRFIQLPPVRARDGDFLDLVDERDVEIDDQWWNERCRQLMACWRECRASVLIVESYPFARRQMRRELIPFLELASQQAIVASSIRDILQPRVKCARDEETVKLLNQFFSALLVHGDCSLVSLDETFPLVAQLQVPIVYTGYVDDAAAIDTDSEHGVDIIVAAGGGAVGLALYRTSLVAAAELPELNWLVLVGDAIPEAMFQRLQESAPPNLSVQRNRTDYRQLLATAVCSVSQAGYNTIVDLLQTHCKAVLVPYSAGGEVEQTIRAQKLAEHGLAVVVSEDLLTASQLQDAISMARRLPEPNFAIDLDGAAKVSQWVASQLNS